MLISPLSTLLSVNIRNSPYATVTFILKAIEPRRVVTGDNVMSIVIDSKICYTYVTVNSNYHYIEKAWSSS